MGKKKPHKEPLFDPREYVSPVSFPLDKVLDRVAERLMDTMDREPVSYTHLTLPTIA